MNKLIQTVKRFKEASIQNPRFRNLYFWLAILGSIFLIATNFGWLGLNETHFDQVMQLVSAIMVISGVWIDPTTPGLTDGESQG